MVLGKARGSKKANNLLIEMINSKGVDFSMPILLGYTGTSDELLTQYIEASQSIWEGNVTDLDKKGLATRVKEKEGDKEVTYVILTDEGMRCKDIAEPLGITGQKCAALLRQLVEAGMAERYTEKRTTYFIKVVA